MPLYLGATVINTTDMETSIAFWTAALGYVVGPRPEESFVVLIDPERRWSFLALQLTDEPKQGLNRLHLDLFTDDQPGEVERLQRLGATLPPWDYPPDDDFVVMRDPDGNEFCIIQTSLSQDSPYPTEGA
jgi:catechol 2,3-dioxygenase-like lactoylglutathione lyase family enzyme